MAGPDGRPAAGPIGHRPAPVRRLRASHRRRVLPAPAKTRHPPGRPATMTPSRPPLTAGALPPHPRPSLKDGQPGQAIFPAGQHSLPQNPREPTRARSARPCGQTLAAPGEPAAAPRVPDREDNPRGGPMPLAKPPPLDPDQPSRNHQLRPSLNQAGPVPCPWRNGGPMLLADDTRTGALADAAAAAPACAAAPAAGPSSTTAAPKTTTARRDGPRIATPHYLPDGTLRGDAGDRG